MRKNRQFFSKYSLDVEKRKIVEKPNIKVMDSFVANCDVAFRKTISKRTNARVYGENLENIGVVYKIDATSNLTKGYILSSEYYENNKEYIFLVKGIGNCFSEKGDSGSLVFF